MTSRARWIVTYQRAGKAVQMYRRAARRAYVMKRRRTPRYQRSVEKLWGRKLELRHYHVGLDVGVMGSAATLAYFGADGKIHIEAVHSERGK